MQGCLRVHPFVRPLRSPSFRPGPHYRRAVGIGGGQGRPPRRRSGLRPSRQAAPSPLPVATACWNAPGLAPHPASPGRIARMKPHSSLSEPQPPRSPAACASSSVPGRDRRAASRAFQAISRTAGGAASTFASFSRPIRHGGAMLRMDAGGGSTTTIRPACAVPAGYRFVQVGLGDAAILNMAPTPRNFGV